MKKRGQRPNDHTFTHLFTGLAKNATLVDARRRAEALYTSLRGKGSPVEPSVIHINAVLRVYGMAGDVDAMFRIASDLPSQGPNQADAITYDTILRGLRRHGDRLKKEAQRQQADPWQRPIALGRRIWEDVIMRWKDGSLKIDAQLIGSMAGLLSHGSLKDIDDIFSLVEQTTGYQRLFPPVGHPDRPTHLALGDRLESVDDETEPYVEGSAQDLLELGEASHDGSRQPSIAPETESVFKPVSLPDGLRFVEPNNFLLSMVLRTCLRFHAKADAQAYWGLFTSRMEPDSQNYVDYLRLLSHSRASSLATELLGTMTLSKDRGGFQMPVSQEMVYIAMTACIRDSSNWKSIGNALKVLSIATEELFHAELPTLRTFVSLVLKERSPTLPQLTLILAALHAQFLAVKSRFSYGKSGRRITKRAHAAGEQQTIHDAQASELDPERQVERESDVEIVRLTYKVTADLLSGPLAGKVPRDQFRKAKDNLFAQQAWLQSSAGPSFVPHRQRSRSDHLALAPELLAVQHLSSRDKQPGF